MRYVIAGVLVVFAVMGGIGLCFVSNFSFLGSGKDALLSQVEAYEEALGGVESPEEAREKIQALRAENEALSEQLNLDHSRQVEAFRQMIR